MITGCMKDKDPLSSTRYKSIWKSTMTDADKKAETKVAAKEKSTAKTAAKPKAAAKASPKAKPKAKAETKSVTKAKPKAEKKSKTDPVDAAPYLTKPKQSASSQTSAKKDKSSTPLILLLAAAILIPTTVYKLDEQLGSQATHSDTQENATKSEAAIQPAQTTLRETPENPVPVPAPITIVATDPVSNNGHSKNCLDRAF